MAISPYYSEVTKIVATNFVSSSPQQGFGLAFSDDGKYLFIGGPNENAVWFYQKIGNAWQQNAKIVPSYYVTYPSFGYNLAVTPSMQNMVVSGHGDNSGEGAVFLMSYDGTAWSQTQRFNCTNGIGSTFFGYKVAIDSAGKTVITGGFTDNSEVGAAWVFVQVGSAWLSSKLVGNDSNGASQQGYSVALTPDGTLAIVGGLADASYNGAIWIYLRSGNAWSQVGSKITNSDGLDFWFGYTMTISSSGTVLVVGGSYSAWVFKRSGNTFVQVTPRFTFTGGAGSPAEKNAVAVNKDGSIIAVGGSLDNNYNGAVWMFTFSGSADAQLGHKINATNVVPLVSGSLLISDQGTSVALDSSGSLLAFSSPYDSNNVGATFVFSNPTITPSPSINPTMNPTTPTIAPSRAPTVTPTMQPSFLPTIVPTALPTVQPSALPTEEPSPVPTDTPTIAPSDEPTVTPITAQPSMQPTLLPTAVPNTATPTLTIAPNQSHRPSLRPIASVELSENTVIGTNTIIAITVAVGAALVLVVVFYFYRCRAHQEYTSKTMTEISQWISDSKHSHAGDIQILDKEKNAEKFMAMTDIYCNVGEDRDKKN